MDDGLFPATYANAPGGGSGPTASAGSGTVLAPGGAGGTPAGQAGSGGIANAGSSAGTGPVASGGVPGAAGTTGGTAATGCPSDITVLFARPIEQGGCTSGGNCHEAGGLIAPDLVSPNLAARLLNVASSCTTTSSGMSVQPRPYIGATDSFLEEKIAGTPNPACGYSMPFFMPDALSAADEQCIVDWIAEVAGGAG